MLVFCDTEKKPHKQYEDIKRKINEFHGIETAVDEVIMFGNLCTIQIITKHWTETLIKSPAKQVNAPLIEEFTGVKNYEWRFGKIPYPEAACSCNLRQLNLILNEMRVYSEKFGYKPSFCYYKRWGTKKKNGQGKKPVIPLRFSKSGNASLEKNM